MVRWSKVKSPDIVKVATRFDKTASKQFHEVRLLVGTAAEFDVDTRIQGGAFAYTPRTGADPQQWVESFSLKNGIELNKISKDAERTMTSSAAVPCTVGAHTWKITVAITDYYGSPGETENDQVDFKCANCP